MKKVVSTEKLPIKLWLDDMESGAMSQAKNLANLPFTFRHVAIMPDSHQGYGMPIGGVLATKEVVIPNAVGVDIGCGMCVMKTSLTEISEDALREIASLIKERIPVGFEHHKQPRDESLLPAGYNMDEMRIVKQQYKSLKNQIGTLGGGNHFIEIQKGSDGNIWVMIHSGSRNIGKKVADYYNNVAINLNSMYCSVIDKSQDLAFLPIRTKEAGEYMLEMKYCIDFALANRRLMMNEIQKCFEEIIPSVWFIAFDGKTITDVAHNYARWENHFGQNVVIHRKGATSAREGEVGIIPGSQGTKSYIVLGLGNQESFMSCSHGAGRKMGRKQAQRELNLEDEIVFMNKKGIIHDMKSIENLDECASAYKDIDVVMENQDDLVKILVELRPLAVIKG